MVSPGKLGSFNSSNAIILPFVKCGNIASKHTFVGSYISKSKYAKDIMVCGLFVKYSFIVFVASPFISSYFFLWEIGDSCSW